MRKKKPLHAKVRKPMPRKPPEAEVAPDADPHLARARSLLAAGRKP